LAGLLGLLVGLGIREPGRRGATLGSGGRVGRDDSRIFGLFGGVASALLAMMRCEHEGPIVDSDFGAPDELSACPRDGRTVASIRFPRVPSPVGSLRLFLSQKLLVLSAVRSAQRLVGVGKTTRGSRS
jgi:hypothetical protein